jgi:cytochrome c-type biogenesis protein
MESVNLFSILVSFAAGLLSFLSPCVLPLVPGYLSLISGVSVEHLKGASETGGRASARRAVIFNSLAFNAGLSMIFISLGAAAGFVGAAALSNPWVRIVGGAVILVFGLHLIGVFKIGAFYRDTRKFSDDKPRGAVGAFALGLAFAAGWTPCIGPILGGIIGLAAETGGWRSGLVLSSFYSAGLALPFLATGLLLNKFLGFYTWFRRHLHKVEVASGVLLVCIGLLIATNNVTRVAAFVSGLVPNAEGVLVRYVERRGAGGEGGDAKRAPTAGAAASAKPAPDVELKTLDGQPFRLSELRGQVVLLNFWATWCVPCRSEIPELNAMQRDLGGRGFAVVGVSTHDTAEEVRAFQQDLQQDYKVLLGTTDAATRFGVVPLPTTFVIDREGRIRQTITGERKRAQFEKEILPLLEETAANP